MNRQSLVHMHDDKVIVSGLGTRKLLGIELRRSLEQTEDGVYVGATLRFRNISPGI